MDSKAAMRYEIRGFHQSNNDPSSLPGSLFGCNNESINDNINQSFVDFVTTAELMADNY